MRLVVPEKLFHELQSAKHFKRFNMDYHKTRRAMIGIACLKCRKARLRAKMKTMWHRHYERRHYAS